MSRFYPSKILLIGEYAVLSGSPFLAVPYSGYRSNWGYSPDASPYLPSIVSFLENNNFDFLDLDRLKRDAQNGLTLHSNIPIGYGVGSSGAISAAVYERYVTDDISDIHIIKNRLSKIESFFHGESSGVDPLVSYLGQPIGKSNQDLGVLPQISLDNNWFLLDSGAKRSTAHLVGLYKKKLESDSFQEIINRMVVINGQLFEAVRNQFVQDIREAMKLLSQLQLTHFREMIPNHVVSIWEKGLLTDAYYLKLCGAGGGGFFLGYDLGHAGKILRRRIVRIS